MIVFTFSIALSRILQGTCQHSNGGESKREIILHAQQKRLLDLKFIYFFVPAMFAEYDLGDSVLV